MKFKEHVVTGIVAGIFATVAIYPAVYASYNSKSEEVNTSRGRVVVRDWQKPKGIEVSVGFETLYDINRDEEFDIKTGGVMGIGKWPCRWNAQVTEADQKFYREVISLSSLCY